MTLIKRIVIEAAADDVKRIMRERREFEADRSDSHGTVRYMAHAGKYVMVRRLGCVPYVMHEDDWSKLATKR